MLYFASNSRRIILAALALAPAGALAQGQQQNPQGPNSGSSGLERQIGAGALQQPKPYGDRGTTSPIGNPPIFYRGGAAAPDPFTYWKNRVIGTGNGCGTTVIVLGGTPCYVPAYYGMGHYPGAFYGDSQFYASLRLGSFQLGYQQNQISNYGYGGVFAPGTGIFTRQMPVDADRVSMLRQRAEARREAQRERREQQARDAADRKADEANDYYLHRKPKAKGPLETDAALAEAVADITATFRSGDPRRLEKHVSPQDVLTLQTKGRTRTPLAGASYLEMTRDALKEMKTVRYELDRVEPASGGAWMVMGSHVIRGEDGKERTFSVSFVLAKRGDVYMVAEVSADAVK